MVDYAYEIGGVDFSGLVERDSYSTSLEPIYSEVIETMNRKRHFVLVRNRGSVTVKLNPQTEEDTARFCAAVLAGPVMVRYHCLQRNSDVYAEMALDNAATAAYLSRCLHRQQRWSELETITLTEL